MSDERTSRARDRGPVAFDALRVALNNISHEYKNQEKPAHQGLRLDPGREARTGIPEVVFAERKRSEDVARSLLTLAESQGRALASRVRVDQIPAIRKAVRPPYILENIAEARLVIVARDGVPPRETGGRIGVISAGASDRSVALEAAVMAREMGCAVTEVADVGVAGLHRLIAPLDALLREGVDALVVAAGMDGALPSVVAGLVAVPVIGLPVSVGYGYGGDGTAALMAMLQTCAPGLSVVNIDNGIGAGSTAALIANRVAAARSNGG
ncbi:MAG: nickel pincer cofactor biosynthesis protein LarB [Chloroflexia bacterium]|nr:nickel pincer cofactor biosynthesis protein LarB [Chloroflexia bacterium]